MAKITITSYSTSPTWSFQDPVPTSGRTVIDLEADTSKTVDIENDVLKRMAAQFRAFQDGNYGTVVAGDYTSNTADIFGDAYKDVHGQPDIYTVSKGSITIGGETGIVAKGIYLAGGNTFGTATLTAAGTPASNTTVVVRSMLPGANGNNFSIHVINSADAGALACTHAHDADVNDRILYTVDFHGAAHTATLVAAVINAAFPNTLYAVAGGNGAGNVALQTTTVFTGGAGNGVALTAGGAACLFTAFAANGTTFTFSTPDLSTGPADTGLAKLIYWCEGRKVSELSLTTTTA